MEYLESTGLFGYSPTKLCFNWFDVRPAVAQNRFKVRHALTYSHHPRDRLRRKAKTFFPLQTTLTRRRQLRQRKRP